MQVLISGSSGLIGSALFPFLENQGITVKRLGRARAGQACTGPSWDPEQGALDSRVFDGMDAVIHLAGESIAQGRWTAGRKARIRDSRVRSTRLLSETLARLDRPPESLLCASAVGYYGYAGDTALTEDSPSGTGFLAGVCREWEKACDPARGKGIRVAHLRIGVVLARHGGALQKMLTPFKMCMGGPVGHGRQYWSWIALDDVAGAIHHALTEKNLAGPINLVSPSPVTNREFSKVLGKVL
ncbi:TIGR01777 family oxidoreductase, partial [Acidobacteriota bacterium]